MWSKTEQYALHSGVKSSPSFTGTGTNDLVVSGSPGFAASRSYKVVIDSTGETFKWSKDGGSTYEATGLPTYRANPVALPLVNAAGEKEGISIRFGSQSGHVNGDFWTFTTTGDVVSATEATLVGAGNGGVVLNTQSADGMILHGQYAKGAESGLRLAVAPLMAGSASSFFNEISNPLNLGTGVIKHLREVFLIPATSNYMYRVDLTGIGAFKVRQISDDSGHTGLFTCYAFLYKGLR